MVSLVEFTRRFERDTKLFTDALDCGIVKINDVTGLFELMMKNAQAEIDMPLVLPVNRCGQCIAFNSQGLCWAIQCERTEQYKTVSKNTLACPIFSAVSLWVNKVASIREQQNE